MAMARSRYIRYSAGKRQGPRQFLYSPVFALALSGRGLPSPAFRFLFLVSLFPVRLASNVFVLCPTSAAYLVLNIPTVCTLSVDLQNGVWISDRNQTPAG